jgi:hypothetical protein
MSDKQIPCEGTTWRAFWAFALTRLVQAQFQREEWSESLGGSLLPPCSPLFLACVRCPNMVAQTKRTWPAAARAADKHFLELSPVCHRQMIFLFASRHTNLCLWPVFLLFPHFYFLELSTTFNTL